MSQSETTPPPPSTLPPHYDDGDQKKKLHNLKYLYFIQLAALKLLLFYSNMYQFSKNNSGPLRPGVQTVEGAVVSVIGPLYRKFHNFPLHFLLLVDRKLDEWIISHAPVTVKEVSGRAWAAVEEVRRIGLAETGARVYVKYELVVKEYAVTGWRGVKGVPVVAQVVEIVVPTAVHWVEKYNKVVGKGKEGGYSVVRYMPLVPVGRIAKIFEGGSSETMVGANGGGGTQLQEF